MLDGVNWEENCTTCNKVYLSDELEWSLHSSSKVCPSCLRMGAIHAALLTALAAVVS